MIRAVVLLLSFLAAAAGTLEGAVSVQRRQVWRKLHAGMAAEVREGSLPALLRARAAAVGGRSVDPGDGDLAGDAAFLGAWLAHEYGLATSNEAAQALEQADRDGRGPGTRAAAMGAGRALLALGRGDRAAAERAALAAADSDRNDIRPLLALGRARAWAGDLAAAAAAFGAASVKAPGAAAPLVAWAEARLDRGEPHAAADVLIRVLAATPEHTAARLLLEEARQALAVRGAPVPDADAAALARGCARDAAIAPVIAAGCALAAADAARGRGDRATALAQARAATAAAVTDPRLLGRAALLLASLGHVDEAEAAATRAAAVAHPLLPALAWARAAIALGRGELAAPPAPPRPGYPDVGLLIARAALAAGGPQALAPALATLEPGALRASPDLRALAALAGAAPAADDATAAPARAYAEGLRARLAGDAPAAVRWLGAALDGHGDACRAAGEYLAALGMVGQPLGGELASLRAVNRSCVNLSGLPPAGEERRRRVAVH